MIAFLLETREEVHLFTLAVILYGVGLAMLSLGAGLGFMRAQKKGHAGIPLTTLGLVGLGLALASILMM